MHARRRYEPLALSSEHSCATLSNRSPSYSRNQKGRVQSACQAVNLNPPLGFQNVGVLLTENMTDVDSSGGFQRSLTLQS